jgi:hypothetical protein
VFGRIDPAQRLAESQARKERNLSSLCQPSRSLHRGSYRSETGNPVTVQKERPVRSEAYRRLVAELPCINCGRQGPSQCAHANTGKGAGIKASDLETFPLCPACHRAFDQGALMPKAERRATEPVWSALTRSRILASGKWPARLPKWEES